LVFICQMMAIPMSCSMSRVLLGHDAFIFPLLQHMHSACANTMPSLDHRWLLLARNALGDVTALDRNSQAVQCSR
jgi:hypothetical protein